MLSTSGTSLADCWNQLRLHGLATVSYCGVFWTFGLCIGFLGPTLLDLLCQLGPTKLNSTTLLFLAQTIFMLAGSLVTSVVLSKFRIEHVLLCAVSIAMITLIMVPYCGSLLALVIVLAVMGLQLGLIDTCGNIAMIELHHRHVAPFLQAMHFFYGLGAFISPIIVKPFLDDSCEDASLNVGKRADSNLTTPAAWIAVTDGGSLSAAFIILAATQIPILFLLDISSHPFSCFIDNNFGSILGLFLVGFLMFIADGIQGALADYVFVYGRKLLPGTIGSADAANLDATFWGLFTFGRLVAVGVAILLSPSAILVMDMLGALIFVGLQILLPPSKTMLFVFAGGLGVCIASLAPVSLALAEQKIGVTASATTFLVLMAALGEILFPAIAGNILDDYEEAAYPIGIGISLLGAVACLFCMGCVMVSRARTDKEQKHIC